MKRYELLGTTDERTTCDLCGRSDLKSTVGLRDLETGEDVFFGSDCAARATGWTIDEVRAATVAADRIAREAAEFERQAAANAAAAAWDAWLLERTGIADTFGAITALGGFAVARALYREAA